MSYDVIAHAKRLDELSKVVCDLEKRFGPKAFADYYRNRLSGGVEASAIRILIDAYVDEKREFTLNLLKWPHEAATLTATESAIARVFNRVGRNQPLAADEIVQPLVAGDKTLFAEFGLLWSYIPDSELHDIAWDEFHGWHGTEGYMHGQIAARPLITPVPVPKALGEIIQEIRMCYAFGQMMAIHGLCRTLLETALTDVCVRVGILTQAEVKDDYFFRDFPPSKRINRILQGGARSEAFELYATTSRVVHGAAKPEDTRIIIRQTMDLVERLYAQHESSLTQER